MHVDEHDGDIIVAGLAGIWLGHKSKHLAHQFQFIPNKQRSRKSDRMFNEVNGPVLIFIHRELYGEESLKRRISKAQFFRVLRLALLVRVPIVFIDQPAMRGDRRLAPMLPPDGWHLQGDFVVRRPKPGSSHPRSPMSHAPYYQ